MLDGIHTELSGTGVATHTSKFPTRSLSYCAVRLWRSFEGSPGDQGGIIGQEIYSPSGLCDDSGAVKISGGRQGKIVRHGPSVPVLDVETNKVLRLNCNLSGGETRVLFSMKRR